MKPAACILGFIWSFLIIQPLHGNLDMASQESACNKKQVVAGPSCNKVRCKMPDPTEDKDCRKDRCNPIMSCPIGNFYLNNHTTYTFGFLTILKEKTSLVNDNRIQKQLTECWHPPEMI
jgi:hypothetical protein